MTGAPYVTCSQLEPRKEEDEPKEKNKRTQGRNISISAYAASCDFPMWVTNKVFVDQRT